MFGDDRMKRGNTVEAVVDSATMQAAPVRVFEVDVVMVFGPVVSDVHLGHVCSFADRDGRRDDAAC